MIENTQHLYRPEVIQAGKRMLFVAPQYGTHEGSIGKHSDEIRHEQSVIELFAKHGFEVRRNEPFDETNRNALGILAGGTRDPRPADEQIANQVGIDMPPVYSRQEALATSNAVVAKIPTVNQGHLKFLLETEEQKARFMTWSIIGDNAKGLLNFEDPEQEIARMMTQVRSGDTQLPLQGTKYWWTPDQWIYEEFVETPGDFYTSFRVVADGFGRIHYSQIACSEKEKTAAYIKPWSTGNPLESLKYGGGLSIWDLLSHPQSPFFIQPKHIVSNIAQGGRRLRLDGKMVTDEVSRDILKGLQINPDAPTLPQDLTKKSQQIGIQFRKTYPYAGIDFLFDAKRASHLLLEINARPEINPAILGLPKEAEFAEIETKFLEDMLKH